MSVRPKHAPARGRPKGVRSLDLGVAAAFGEVVRAARAEAGLSQEGLAAASHLERSYFGRIERGQSQPTLFALLKIASALKLPVADLVSPVETAWKRGRTKDVSR